MPIKILIIRLSSIGDIIQCVGTIGGIRQWAPDAEIHWVTRSDMAQTLSIDTRIDKIWSFDKNEGFSGLLRFADQLKAERFDYIYDAHSNHRSKIIRAKLLLRFGKRPKLIIRHKERFKRTLLFKLGINKFDWPFIGAESYRLPLQKWGITSFDDKFQDWQFPAQVIERFKGSIPQKCITLVPSANWAMKRWPLSHWCSLVELMPDYTFKVLAGPSDDFCEQIRSVAPDRVENLAGQCSIMETSYIVSQSKLVVSGDTGFMHAADLFGTPAIALMGPTAFGYPARETSQVLEVELRCRPCTKDGRGNCSQDVYQRCMVDITPQRVAERARKMLE